MNKPCKDGANEAGREKRKAKQTDRQKSVKRDMQLKTSVPKPEGREAIRRGSGDA